jgi:hypothetical protein
MRYFRQYALMLGWAWISLAAGCAPHFAGRDFIRHVAYLASDDLAGRATGTPGNDQAAEYIAWQFQQAGLKPRGEKNTYFQHFEIPMGVEMLGRPALNVAGAPALGLLGRDFTPFPFSAMEAFEGPLAFAGYGISNPDEKYDDYAGFDASGKVLLMFRYEPHASDPKAKFGGETASRHAAFQTKATQAKSKGAKAILIVNPPFHHGKDDRLFDFISADRAGRFSLPMMHVTQEYAGRLLKAAGADGLAALQRDLDKRKPRSMDLEGLTARGDPGLVRRKIQARNVIAELNGQGPDADEYIVVGAHYDHVGRAVPRGRTTTRPAGADQTEIHNGADDNASGTSGVIELARAFGHYGSPDRSMLFMAFSAEEIGLVGSAHYVNHPMVPLEKTVAMINLDMIGRLRGNKLEVLGTGSATQFERLAKYRGELLGMKIKATGNGYGGSDQSSFLSKQIPVMFFFTGMHTNYHMPSDDTETLNAEGGARVVQLAYSVAESLAAAPARPMVVADAKKEVKAPAEKKPEPPAPRAGLKVRFGVMPSYAPDEEPGLVIQGATPGSAAERAGLIEGDRVLKVDEHEVNDVFGLMEALKGYNPGDVARIIVLRGTKRMEFSVKFDANTPEPGQKTVEPEEPEEEG